jgi:hypothetical protein
MHMELAMVTVCPGIYIRKNAGRDGCVHCPIASG